ncbi:unnamed protein product [Laminaria digitata]
MGRIVAKAKHRRPVSETALPSRGQRKRALKKASLIKKISLTERVQRGAGEPKNGDLATESGESALTSTIATGAKLKCPTRVAFQRVISNKGKRTLMAAEMGQVNAVLAADSFQQDPFLAIQARILAHLRQKAEAAPPVVDSKTDNTKKKAKAPREGRESKRVGKHAQESRGGRTQSVKAKPYKGRNAKMRVKR